jgi:hypothetical protein
MSPVVLTFEKTVLFAKSQLFSLQSMLKNLGFGVALTLIQPGSGKSVNYWGLFDFDLAFMRGTLTSPSVGSVCNRALRFRESTQNGAATLQYYTEKERETGPTENPSPPRTLRIPGPANVRNVNWRRTALRTKARRDFSHIKVVCSSSKTGRKQRRRQRRTVTELLTKNVKMDANTSFFDVMSEVQKDLEDDLQE